MQKLFTLFLLATASLITSCSPEDTIDNLIEEDKIYGRVSGVEILSLNVTKNSTGATLIGESDQVTANPNDTRTIKIYIGGGAAAGDYSFTSTADSVNGTDKTMYIEWANGKSRHSTYTPANVGYDNSGGIVVEIDAIEPGPFLREDGKNGTIYLLLHENPR